jgi:hypothetical protein
VRISSVNNSLGKCGREQTTNDNGIIAYLQTVPEPFGHLVIHTNHSVTHYLLKEF